MAYWLVKTEPGDYSYGDLERDGRGVWDGVRGFQAQKHLRAMRPGDQVFIYHTGKEKAIAGVAEVASAPYPDPGSPGGPYSAVDVIPRYRLPQVVSLAEVKGEPAFSGWELVRLPRLSVMPVSAPHWQMIHVMARSVPEVNKD